MSVSRPFLWVHLTDEELSVYGPDKYESYEKACDAMKKDINKIAKHNQRKASDVMEICRERCKERLKELYWKGGEDDPEEGQAADNIEGCGDDASGSVMES